ncbi:MAG: hypothetical protein ACRDNF_02615, partial [Streptosporangiaceae bacterium]
MPEEQEAHAARPVNGPADLDLRADCANCFALCCVAPAFSVSSDFAIDKPAGQPCQHLQADFRCGIHSDLPQRGFTGCTLFDCFGAGQKVSQVTFGGRDWRRDPGVAEQMFAVFAIMRDLHDLLWYLTNALNLRPAGPLHGELSAAIVETERLTHHDAAALLRLDVGTHRQKVGVLLLRAGDLVRAEVLGTFVTDPAASLSAHDLAQETGLEIGSLKPILTRLVRARWITMQDGPTGRHYILTEQGASL